MLRLGQLRPWACEIAQVTVSRPEARSATSCSSAAAAASRRASSSSRALAGGSQRGDLVLTGIQGGPTGKEAPPLDIEIPERGLERALDPVEPPFPAGGHHAIIGRAAGGKADQEPERSGGLDGREGGCNGGAERERRENARQLAEHGQNQHGEESHPGDAEPVIGVGEAARGAPGAVHERRLRGRGAGDPGRGDHEPAGERRQDVAALGVRQGDEHGRGRDEARRARAARAPRRGRPQRSPRGRCPPIRRGQARPRPQDVRPHSRGAVEGGANGDHGRGRAEDAGCKAHIACRPERDESSRGDRDAATAASFEPGIRGDRRRSADPRREHDRDRRTESRTSRHAFGESHRQEGC